MKSSIGTIGVFFGGKSSEAEISIITGEFILAELKKMGFSARGVFIDENGNFYLDETIGALKFFKGDYKKQLSTLSSYSLNLNASKNKLIFESNSFFKKQITIDFAFPAFHGTGGEDGTIQGMWEFFGVPYAGCGVWSLATTIHKGLTKKIFEQNSIPTSKFLTFLDSEYANSKNQILETINTTLSYPIFVKPTKAGSSIGISKVNKKEELQEALELAFYYDNEIIVENGVLNVRDLTCAILSNGEHIFSSEIQESPIGDTFFDYNKKYLEDGGGQLGKSETIIIPANITEEQKTTIQNLSKNIFQLTQGNGTMRVDFLMNNETGKIFANEINPLPGTLYHHLWEKSGISIDKVLEMMILDGMKRAKNNKTQTAHFSSGVLDNANALKLQM